DFGNAAEGGVAGEVAEEIVDALEAIDVDHQERRRLPRPLRPFNLPGKGVVEPAAVVEAGERIDGGNPLEVALQPQRLPRDQILPADSAGQDSQQVPPDVR